MAFLENTFSEHGSQYLSILVAPSQLYKTSSEGIPAQIQQDETPVSLFIISFLISSVAFGEDRIFCNVSNLSLGISSSRTVLFSGRILNVSGTMK